DARSKAVDELYRSTVPLEQRVEEVTFKLGVEAELPNGQRVSVPPDASLPTDTRVVFNVEVSAEAWVYIFQKSPDGSLSVLFPNEEMGTKNLLQAGVIGRIPPGDARFRLNDKDIGTEKVFIAVSRKAIARLGDALSRVNAGKLTSIAGDTTLQTLGTVDDGGKGKPCARSRGLDMESASSGDCMITRGLEPDDGGGSSAASGGASPSLAARTEPGDSLIVKVFSFEHLTAQQFAAKGSQIGGKRRKRGVIEEQ